MADFLNGGIASLAYGPALVGVPRDHLSLALVVHSSRPFAAADAGEGASIDVTLCALFVVLSIMSKILYIDSVQDQLLRAIVPATNINGAIATMAYSPDCVGVPLTTYH
jgi:hypothetical protein